MPDTPDKTPLENGSNDVEVVTEEIKRVEIVVGEKWIKKQKRKNVKAREYEYAERTNKWLFTTHGLRKEGQEMDMRWLKEEAEKELEKAGEGSKLELADAYIAAWMMVIQRKEKWEMKYGKDRMVFTIED